MWTSLAVMAALSLAPEQPGSFALTNPRATYGLQGAVRPDNRILPGDAFFLTFDMENVKVDPMGRVFYSMGMEIYDPKDKSIKYKQDPRDVEALNSLGGTSLPAFAYASIGLDHPAGKYVMKVTVTDRVAKVTRELERPFEVLKPAFGIVRLQLSCISTDATPERYSAPPLGAPGQIVFVNFALVGYELDPKTKKPNLKVEMTIIDEATKKETLAQPFTGEVNKDAPENIRGLPMIFSLVLNRPGRFTVKLKATDLLSKDKKTSELSFPFNVYPTASATK